MYVSEIPAFREYWYPVGYSADTTTRPRKVRLLGDDYVIWRGTPDGPVGAAVDELFGA